MTIHCRRGIFLKFRRAANAAAEPDSCRKLSGVSGSAALIDETSLQSPPPLNCEIGDACYWRSVFEVICVHPQSGCYLQSLQSSRWRVSETRRFTSCQVGRMNCA
jgi:hypothetical protein